MLTNHLSSAIIMTACFLQLNAVCNAKVPNTYIPKPVFSSAKAATKDSTC